MTQKLLPNPDKTLDLRGEVCPYTFIRSKLALEGMAIGEVLKSIVDFEPSTRNIPRSMEGEGQEILAVEEVAPHVWEIYVRKREE